MNTPQTPDYGEPWHEQTATMNKGVHWINTKQFNRAVSCVNACAGMTDPVKEIEAMREAIKEAHEVLDTAQRQWSHYAEFRDDEDLATAKHLEGDLYRSGQAALTKLQSFIKP